MERMRGSNLPSLHYVSKADAIVHVVKVGDTVMYVIMQDDGTVAVTKGVTFADYDEYKAAFTRISKLTEKHKNDG